MYIYLIVYSNFSKNNSTLFTVALKSNNDIVTENIRSICLRKHVAYKLDVSIVVHDINSQTAFISGDVEDQMHVAITLEYP